MQRQDNPLQSRVLGRKELLTGLLSLCIGWGTVLAGPYSDALDDPANDHDAPVPGFVGPHGPGKARLSDGGGGFQNEDNYVNPIFFDWASSVVDYSPAPGVAPGWMDESKALGEVTGESFDVASLGDLDDPANAPDGVDPNDPDDDHGFIGIDEPGSITLHFSDPIVDLTGADFVLFENGLLATFDTGGVGIGGIFAELAYVEVSSNGTDFTRFNSATLNDEPVNTYGTIDPTDVHNLAGKHVNSSGDSWGTPFDLADVGLSSISYIRVVDIPGSGDFVDGSGDPIYDSWPTSGSGGIDIEAVGSISTRTTFATWPQLGNLPTDQRGESDDPDRDGLTNLEECALGLLPWSIDNRADVVRLELVEQAGETAAEITFVRDERLTDVVYEVCVSTDLKNWIVIARSSSGQPCQGVGSYAPEIAESSAGEIASIGVLRRVRVRDVVTTEQVGKRFLQLKIIRQP